MTDAVGVTPGERAGEILRVAANSGVERLWFVSGSELTSLQEAFARARALGDPTPELLTCTHEHVALSAALGDSMIHGRPSMTAGHADLGLLHQGGAIHNALWGDHPVLMLSGYPPTEPAARDSPVFWKQQRFDPGGIVRQYVKWDHRLAAGDDAGLITARALQMALSPRTGPVYLAMPEEVGRLPVRPGPVDSARCLGVPRLGAGDHAGITEIADRLLGADAAVILTDRIGNDHDAVAALDELATTFGIGVRASRHRMNLRDGHPCDTSGIGLDEFDVVVVLEHPVPWVPATERPSAGAWVAWVGTDPVESRIPLYEYPAALRLTADPGAFVRELIAELTRRAGPGDRARAATRAQRLAAARPQARPAPADPRGRPTPGQVAEALGAALSPEDIVTWEVADTARLARTRPGTLFEKGGSSLGWSVAAAVGARIASGDTPTVALAGDGSYLFGSPDSCLWLQQQYDAPVLTVLLNNRGYRTGTSTLVRHYPQGHAAREPSIPGGHLHRTPDFAAHARSQGAFGERVTAAADLAAAIGRARTAVERDRVPAVLDIRVPGHLHDRYDPDSAEEADQ